MRENRDDDAAAIMRGIPTDDYYAIAHALCGYIEGTFGSALDGATVCIESITRAPDDETGENAASYLSAVINGDFDGAAMLWESLYFSCRRDLVVGLIYIAAAAGPGGRSDLAAYGVSFAAAS